MPQLGQCEQFWRLMKGWRRGGGAEAQFVDELKHQQDTLFIRHVGKAYQRLLGVLLVGDEPHDVDRQLEPGCPDLQSSDQLQGVVIHGMRRVIQGDPPHRLGEPADAHSTEMAP